MKTVTLSDETIETIIAALHQRARLYGSDTRRDREEQETIYRIIADIDLQTTSLIKERSIQ